MPSIDGLRLDDHYPVVKTAGPKTIEQNPEDPVESRQPGAGSLTVSQNLQLIAKSHHLELKVDPSPEAGNKAVNDGNDDFAHDTNATRQPLEKRGFLRRTEFTGGTGVTAADRWPLSGQATRLKSDTWRGSYPKAQPSFRN